MSTASVPVGAAALVRRRPPPAVRRQRFLVAVANHSLLIAAAAAFVAPFVFITLTALMTNGQALSARLWPHPFAWHNFAEVFTTAHDAVFTQAGLRMGERLLVTGAAGGVGPCSAPGRPGRPPAARTRSPLQCRSGGPASPAC